MKKFFCAAFAILLFNLLMFQIYRLVFLNKFCESYTTGEAVQTCLYGLRLDAALLGFEILGISCICILFSRMKLQTLFRFAYFLTCLHLLVCIANIETFQERNQHTGELLFLYITSPYQIYIAVIPFIANSPFHFILCFPFLFGIGYAGIRYSRRWRENMIYFWTIRKNLLCAIVCALSGILVTLQPVTVKKVNIARGWKLRIAESKYYTHLSSFMLNQAIINPFYEIFTVNLPLLFKRSHPYRMSEKDALTLSCSILKVKHQNEKYPFLTSINSDYGLNLKNVVIIQVEGLSACFVHHQSGGKPVMPYLDGLSKEGLSFPNAFQSFNSTAGSVFATMTSFHKAGFEENTKRFSSFELSSHYGCLPEIFKHKDYTHFFCFAFRHVEDEYKTFMGNNGYITLGYHDFKNRLDKKGLLAEADEALGIFDSYFFQECAELLCECPKNFTMHLVTATTHSPWTVPKAVPLAFHQPQLDTFAYVDSSIQSFVETLRQKSPGFDDTLFVIVADHVSLTLHNEFSAQIRIPLIFYNTRLARIKEQWKDQQTAYASHVDILPTILDLMGGQHSYSGMGMSLLSPDAKNKGVIGGTTKSGYYIKGRFLFQYFPFQKETSLFVLDNNKIIMEDVSSKYSHILNEMKQEYLSQYETSKRLLIARRAFPRES